MNARLLAATGAFSVPLTAPIEGGSGSTGDRHALAVDTDNCVLYELYRAFPGSNTWVADSGAIFDLKSNALRPATWTSADAAGLPIMPGLVTYEEVASGEIKHAIRFTVPQTRRAFVWPGRHYASTLTGEQYPRMGERFRLKATYDVSTYPAEVRVILRAMQKYGIILADNGSAWFISGKPDPRWNNDNLSTLGRLLGENFEAVDATVLQVDPNSGEARQSSVAVSVSPSSATVRVSGSRQFAATVTGAAGGVSWSVNDIAGGNALVGTIDSTGLYLAPAVVPSPSTVTVRATSTASATTSGAAIVTLIPRPTISSVSPSPVSVGNFTLTVNGAGYVPGSTISFDGASLPTTYVSANVLTGTGNAASPKASVPVVVTTPDISVSNTLYVEVVQSAPVSISVSPLAATVKVKATQSFTATVQGSTNTAVVWKVNGIVGGEATVGTISTAGIYKAPNSVPKAAVTVSATSAADPTKSASASITVTRR